MKPYKLSALLLILVCISGCTSYPPLNKTADYVDPDRFAGQWYVISNIPYFAERNKVASRTTYKRRGDNLFDDIFESKNKSFDAELKRLEGTVKSINDENTRWQSTFYKVIKFKFDVLDVNPDYSVVLLGHPSRKYGWVMARQNTISDADYQIAMQTFADNGYDLTKFGKVPQLPEQLNQPGFHTIAPWFMPFAKCVNGHKLAFIYCQLI